MFKLHLKPVVLLFCVFYVLPASLGWAADNKFGGSLGCSQIGPRHPEQTAASGEVFFAYDENRQELSYRLEVASLKDPYMAHVHIGPCEEERPVEAAPTEQGPIAAWLFPTEDQKGPERHIEGVFTGVLAEGVIRPENLKHEITMADLITAMRGGNAYVNVHTKKYITCEICGVVGPVE